MANPQTLQQVLNRALVSLRQGQIASGTTQLTDTYQLVLLEFFNQIREEIEDACNWRAIWQTFTVTIPGGSNFAAVTGSNERSRVVRVPIIGGGSMDISGLSGAPISGSDRLVPLVFDVTAPSTSGNSPLDEMPIAALQYMNFVTNKQTVSQPQAFAFGAGNTDNSAGGAGEGVLYVYPAPNNTRTIQITLAVPELDYGPLDVARNVYIPTQPLLQGLLWMAREERGEELGPQGLYTEERYRTTLDAHVSREIAESGDSLDCILV